MTMTKAGDRNAREIHGRIVEEHIAKGGIYGRHGAWVYANFYAGRPGASNALAVLAHYNRALMR